MSLLFIFAKIPFSIALHFGIYILIITKAFKDIISITENRQYFFRRDNSNKRSRLFIGVGSVVYLRKGVWRYLSNRYDDSSCAFLLCQLTQYS